MRVIGVDFSGAQDAGRALWLTEALACDGWLQVGACFPAAELWGAERSACLAGLVSYLTNAGESIVGLDFPFAVPDCLMQGYDWPSYVLDFGHRFPEPAAFRRDCMQRAGGRELRRFTDRETRTPFSSYNLRIYRQTYYGIRDVLAPLLRQDAACVLPMQLPVEGKPWLIEACPACALKRLGLARSYKGRDALRRQAREALVQQLEACCGWRLAEATRERLLADSGGDALDSVIAAWIAARAREDPGALSVEAGSVYAREGVVYA